MLDVTWHLEESVCARVCVRLCPCVLGGFLGHSFIERGTHLIPPAFRKGLTQP